MTQRFNEPFARIMPVGLTAMMVTADGAVRFMKVSQADPQIRVAIMRSLVPDKQDPLTQAASVAQRVYELVDRHDNVLTYRERVD